MSNRDTLSTAEKMLESTLNILYALGAFTDDAMDELAETGTSVHDLLQGDERFESMLRTVDLTVVMPLFKMMTAAHAYADLTHATYAIYGPQCVSLMWDYDTANRKLVNIAAYDEVGNELDPEDDELRLNSMIDFEAMLFSGLAPYWQKGGEVTVI